MFKNPVDKLKESAARAHRAGDELFAPKLTMVGDTTGAMLTAIEAQGWKLEHWAVGSSGGPSPVVGYPVFRANVICAVRRGDQGRQRGSSIGLGSERGQDPDKVTPCELARADQVRMMGRSSI